MMTYVLLMAGLLGATTASPSAGAPPDPEPRKELVIPFAWQPTEKWQVEIRAYQFRRGMPPKRPTVPWNIERREQREHRGLPLSRAVEGTTIDKLVDVPVLRVEVIETHYSRGLRALFDRGKNPER
jgi:hypothetical protein